MIRATKELGSTLLCMVLTCKLDYHKLKSITERNLSKEDLQYKLMHCCSEIDGLRVMNNKYIYFISRVSSELFKTCFGFSRHPAKKLLSAFKLYLSKSV